VTTARHCCCAADIALQLDEHSDFRRLPIAEASEAVWSWTNQDALWNLALT
jgi:hypothetical protein